MPITLPTGESFPAFVKRVRASQPMRYADRIATACAFQDGYSEAATVETLRRNFPATWDRMVPRTVGLVERVAETKALVFEGSPQLLLSNADGEPVTETPDGTQWADVLLDGDVLATLRRGDLRSVVQRQAFVRFTWDDVEGYIRSDVFDAHAVLPLLDPDRPDVMTAPVVAFEIAGTTDKDGRPVRRYEVWTAMLGTDEAGQPTTSATVTVVDEAGNVLSEPTPNPYRWPDGTPLIPVVRLGDTTSEPWPWPRESVLSAQLAVNVDITNRNHVTLMQGHGQWSVTQTERNADPWPGSALKSVRANRLTDDPSDVPSVSVAMGPDEIARVPYGFSLSHTSQGANLDGLLKAEEATIREFAAFEGIPSGALLDSAREVSGVALLLEREPLHKYRRDRIAAFHRAVERALDYVVIVWDTHAASNAGRFSTPERPAHGVFRPDRLRPLMDPSQAADLANKMRATGLYSPAEIRARVEGTTIEEAEEALRAVPPPPNAGALVPPLFAARGAPVLDDDDGE